MTKQVALVLEELLQRPKPFSKNIPLSFFRGKNFALKEIPLHPSEETAPLQISEKDLELDPLLSFHQKLQQRTRYFHLQGKEVETPIILHFHHHREESTEENTLLLENIQLLIDTPTPVIILEDWRGFAPEVLQSRLMKIKLGKKAQVTHLQTIHADTAQLVNASNLIEVSQDASYKSCLLQSGEGLLSHKLSVELTGANARCELLGATLLSSGQSAENITQIHHIHGNTESRQVYKALLARKSRTSFDGSILVREQAQNIRAQQLHKSILLDKLSQVETKPQLLINANDVQCTHGATVGQLDADELFYLQTRGFSPQEAQFKLVSAFFNADIVDTKMQNALQGQLKKVLESL